MHQGFEQCETLFQMKIKYQKLGIGNFEWFKVYYGVVMVSEVLFIKLWCRKVAVQRCCIQNGQGFFSTL